MAISDSSITDVELVNTFEQWRSKTNQIITVLNEQSDDDPSTALLSSNSVGGLSINTITSNIVTGANVTGSKLLFSGGTVDFTGATTTDLGTVEKFALVETAGATVTGASPDSKIERCQINEVEINLNGKNLNANGSSTITLTGATIADLGTVSLVTIDGGTINDANVNITDDSGAKIITISAAGPHILTGATFANGTFNNAYSVGGYTHSANISVNTASAFVANVGAIFGADVATANVAIGDFPEYTTAPLAPSSSKGRLHIRSDFADAGTTNPTAAVSTADELVLENENDVGMTFLSDVESNAHIMFGDSADADIGGIVYNHLLDSMYIVTGGANTVELGNEYGGYMQVAGGDTLGTQTGKLHVNVGSSDGTAGIFLDSNDVDQIGVSIDAAQTTANVFEINADAFTTGHVISIHRGLGTGDSNDANGSLIHLTDNNSSTNARAILDIVQNTTGATGSTGLKITTDGGTGISVIQNQNTNPGLNVWATNAHSTNLGHFQSDAINSTGVTLYVQGNSSTGGTKVVEFANSTGSFFAGRANGVTWCSRLEVDTFLTPDNTAVNMFAVRDTSGTIVNPGT